MLHKNRSGSGWECSLTKEDYSRPHKCVIGCLQRTSLESPCNVLRVSQQVDVVQSLWLTVDHCISGVYASQLVRSMHSVLYSDQQVVCALIKASVVVPTGGGKAV